MAVRDPSEFNFDLVAWAEDCVENGHLPVMMPVGEQHMGWHTFSLVDPDDSWAKKDVSTVIDAAVRARAALDKMAEEQDGGS